VKLVFFYRNDCFSYSEDKKRAWKVVKARTLNHATFHMEYLQEENSDFADWLIPLLPKCGTFNLLAKGIPRRGQVTSNPSEQFNATIVPERNMAVCDLISSILGKMNDSGFKRGRFASQRLRENKLLVPRAETEHRLVITKATRYEVFFNEQTDTEAFATVRAPGGSACFRNKLFRYRKECMLCHNELNLYPKECCACYHNNTFLCRNDSFLCDKELIVFHHNDTNLYNNDLN
jgi:hypothetical protein